MMRSIPKECIVFDQTNPDPLIYTSKGNLPEAGLRMCAVWSDMETPIAQAKAKMLARIAALEAAMLSGDGPRFHVAMLELKAAAEEHVQLDEIVCNVEHWQGDECVRRQVNIKKLKGESALGQAAVMG